MYNQILADLLSNAGPRKKTKADGTVEDEDQFDTIAKASKTAAKMVEDIAKSQTSLDSAKGARAAMGLDLESMVQQNIMGLEGQDPGSRGKVPPQSAFAGIQLPGQANSSPFDMELVNQYPGASPLKIGPTEGNIDAGWQTAMAYHLKQQLSDPSLYNTEAGLSRLATTQKMINILESKPKQGLIGMGLEAIIPGAGSVINSIPIVGAIANRLLGVKPSEYTEEEKTNKLVETTNRSAEVGSRQYAADKGAEADLKREAIRAETDVFKARQAAETDRIVAEIKAADQTAADRRVELQREIAERPIRRSENIARATIADTVSSAQMSPRENEMVTGILKASEKLDEEKFQQYLEGQADVFAAEYTFGSESLTNPSAGIARAISLINDKIISLQKQQTSGLIVGSKSYEDASVQIDQMNKEKYALIQFHSKVLERLRRNEFLKQHQEEITRKGFIKSIPEAFEAIKKQYPDFDPARMLR